MLVINIYQGCLILFKHTGKGMGRSEHLPQVFSVQTRRGEECSNYEHAARALVFRKWLEMMVINI